MRLNNLFFQRKYNAFSWHRKSMIFSCILFIVVLFFIASCTNNQQNTDDNLEFKKMCTDSGYEWMHMKPTQNGKIIKDSNECLGCMVGLEHICDKEKFKEFVKQE